MNNKILLPDDIWKYILSLLSCHNQVNLVKKIFNYYNIHSTLDIDVYNRQKLSKLLNIALKYDYCLKLLNEDDAFNDSYLHHINNNKLFKNMDWINSLISSIWMYKYH